MNTSSRRLFAVLAAAMLTLYGLKTCDSCRGARRALSKGGIAHDFHDLRDEGLAAERIAAWAAKVGWEKLLNRKSRTWRELSDSSRQGLDEPKAVALMAANPTVIKRPVIEYREEVLVGFDAATLQRLIA